MTKGRTGSVEYGVCILASALFILIIGAFAVPLAASFSPLFVKTESARIAGGYIARTALRTLAIAFFSTLTAAAVGAVLPDKVEGTPQSVGWRTWRSRYRG